MHMLFRTLLIFLRKKSQKPARISEVTRYTMRVWPTDLDILMHVNNGVYFSLMDFGRWNMVFRNGTYDLAQKNGWYAVVGGETIKFVRSLGLWDKFTIETQIVGHDEKYFYIAQKILKHGEVQTSGLVKVRFLKKSGGTVSVSEVMSNYQEVLPVLRTDLAKEWASFDAKQLK